VAVVANAETKRNEEPSFIGSLGIVLLGVFALVVICSAIAYIALGFVSMGYYGASIGQVMQFTLNVAAVSGGAITALFILLAALHEVKWFRRRVHSLLGKFSEP
jgi:predicted outer membrane repeat protein